MKLQIFNQENIENVESKIDEENKTLQKYNTLLEKAKSENDKDVILARLQCGRNQVYPK